MMTHQQSLRFNEQDILDFARFSHDYNPLHCDSKYARGTVFGEQVVHGMLVVFKALSHWAKSGYFRISKIEGTFRQPLYIDRDYTCCFEEHGQSLSCEILSGSSLLATFTMDWERWDRIDHPKREIHPSLEFVKESKHYTLHELKALSCLPSQKFQTTSDFYELHIPELQKNALAWASYFVGMVCPGKKALFSSFEFEFNHEKSTTFETSPVSLNYDEDLNLVRATGWGNGISSFELRAFRRPGSVEYPIHEVQKLLGSGQKFLGKTAFISGASRGFGSVLAKALALQGAKVFVHYGLSEESANAVCHEIKNLGGQAETCKADLLKDIDCMNLALLLKDRKVKFDFLINNASVPIKHCTFENQTPHDFLSFVNKSLGIYLRLTHALLPMMKEHATIVNVSSVYVESPQAGFSHYVAAKRAIEGMADALALEHPTLRIVNFRAPKMLTDQTNSILPQVGCKSAIEVVKELIALFYIS